MELIITGAIIGVTCVLIGALIVSFNENQKKKAFLQQIITRAIVELNENKDMLKQLQSYLKPGGEVIEKIEESKKLAKLLESNSFNFKYDELNQLKLSGDFTVFVDVKVSVMVSNVLTRLKYINQTLLKNKTMASFSTDEYKTIYHTHDMVKELIDVLTGELDKIKR